MHQTITTPSGEKLVIIPQNEFNHLVELAEDTADIRIYNEAITAIKNGENELIPAEFADRILDGENPIKVWREYRGMTMAELAKTAEISASYMSQIESGKKEGSIEVLKKLAFALHVDVDDII